MPQPALVALALVLGLAACATPPPPPTVHEYVNEPLVSTRKAEDCNMDNIICQRMRARDPVKTTCRPPAYPADSLEQGEEGTSTVDVWIEADGRVREARVVTPNKYARLDQATVDALSSCVFPATSVTHSGGPGPYRFQFDWRIRPDGSDGAVLRYPRGPRPSWSR